MLNIIISDNDEREGNNGLQTNNLMSILLVKKNITYSALNAIEGSITFHTYQYKNKNSIVQTLYLILLINPFELSCI